MIWIGVTRHRRSTFLQNTWCSGRLLGKPNQMSLVFTWVTLRIACGRFFMLNP